MRVLRTFNELAATKRDAYVAIGVFDGVHLGHQRVIGQARDDATAQGGQSVVLTFDPHPMRVLRPDQAPLLLTSTNHKLTLIEQLGVDACLLINFDQTFAATPPEKFIEQIAAPAHQLREVCVGTRFRFGHNRAGDVAFIEQLAPRYGFTVKEIKSVHTPAGEMISSTAVRQHVLAGNLDRAAVMLGRPFSVLGTVEHGVGLGRQLGYPTANLDSHSEALPPNGVYAVRAQIVERASRPFIPPANGRDARSTTQTHAGIVNIGVRPTFAGRAHHRQLEVHLFDFDRPIYGQNVEVVFIQKLREEQKFESAEALKAQIARDIVAARQLTGASH